MTREAKREDFAARSRGAIANAQLQRALANATAKHTGARASAIDVMGDSWEALRERAKEIKDHTLAHLDYYLDEFSSNVERMGGHVFWAADAAAANDYIRDLARSRRVKLAVKGKSMMTEEVELNRALAAAGVEAVETDLGEYIVQLAGERPSHITAPAVHKTRGDIARLFSEKLGVSYGDDPVVITAHAQRLLRGRFAAAGMGVTGVNFAVAETGTIVLVENEGNIRMTTSLPRVHVALMGIEKVIPRLGDLEVFLKLLPRAAAGQNFTSYVSFLSGVKRSREEEGPDEFHVVILDNGRAGMLADAHLREALNCIRCGACLNACPVYRKIGGHAYGWIYPGPIGAVLTPQLLGPHRAADLPFASTLCGACRDVCPVKIDIPGMLLRLRHESKESAPPPTARATVREPTAKEGQGGYASDGDDEGGEGTGDRHRRRAALGLEKLAFKVWAFVIRSASRYERAARLARLAQRMSGGRAFRLAPPFSRWAAARELPALPARSFREQWEEIEREAAGVPALNARAADERGSRFGR